MANLSQKNGIFLIRFRFQQKEYKKSLKLRTASEAENAKRLVETTIHRLSTGQLQVPPQIDPGDFIVSGGTLCKSLKNRRPSLLIHEAIEAFLAAQKLHLAASTHQLFRYHLNHWLRHSGGTGRTKIDSVTHAQLESYLRTRIEAASETTAAKERRTLMQLFRWLVQQEHIRENPALKLTVLRSESERPPYRTIQEIEAILGRGGLSDQEQLDMWECIYLQPQEIAELLQLVKTRYQLPLSYLLHAIPAYTGMRRGELLRLNWQDIDWEQKLIRARSLKQSRRKRETIRTIQIHEELFPILQEWKRTAPLGQLVLPDPDRNQALIPSRANRFFQSPLRKTNWCLNDRKGWFKIGFHTYRHSFVSNLAVAGVDQRIIDEFVGHSTESMRRRYRHLLPSAKQAAIHRLSYQALPTSSNAPPPHPSDRSS